MLLTGNPNQRYKKKPHSQSKSASRQYFSAFCGHGLTSPLSGRRMSVPVILETWFIRIAAEPATNVANISQQTRPTVLYGTRRFEGVISPVSSQTYFDPPQSTHFVDVAPTASGCTVVALVAPRFGRDRSSCGKESCVFCVATDMLSLLVCVSWTILSTSHCLSIADGRKSTSRFVHDARPNRIAKRPCPDSPSARSKVDSEFSIIFEVISVFFDV
ncbi:uncharacterized protein CCOS01_00475 [Colletotrichum costaricense]|uniref:Uncharacterized protein n=1 Tax=Colletotrichum costaricense TaxID=1209916 RepID=A0AAJ0E768_9PEZI|nr:uncharacterized protein CCOS01_00475 [Colletotrichum costaricense]KAK1539161.1 hypothetical protein CCOS01_00475 [Colletotrichum costaricense]